MMAKIKEKMILEVKIQFGNINNNIMFHLSNFSNIWLYVSSLYDHTTRSTFKKLIYVHHFIFPGSKDTNLVAIYGHAVGC